MPGPHVGRRLSSGFDHVYLLVPAQAEIGMVLAIFAAFPPRQKAASFSVGQVIAKLKNAAGGGMH